MTTTLNCISPVDGSVFAKRETLSAEVARAAIAETRAAQAAWAARPLQERVDLVMAGVAAVGEMNDEIVPELARMMGRPVRYGGEFGGFYERVSYMAEIAAQGLADIEVSDDGTFHRYIRRVPHGVVFVVAPWNYPYMTAINTVAPALHAAGVPEAVFRNVFLDHDTTATLISEGQLDFVNFTGSVGGGQAMG